MANPLGNPTWKKGVGGNPKGRPAGSKCFIDRARYLMEEYTIEAIQELVEDKRQFNKLPVYDAMVMKRIIEAVSDNGKAAMDSLLDRVIGKPTQHIEQAINQTVEVNVNERRQIAQEEAQAILTQLANRKLIDVQPAN